MVILNELVDIKNSHLFFNKAQVELDYFLMKKDCIRMTIYIVSKPLNFFRREENKIGCRIYKQVFWVSEKTTDFCKKEDRVWSSDEKEQQQMLNRFRKYLNEFAYDMFQPLLDAQGKVTEDAMKQFEKSMIKEGNLQPYQILEATSSSLDTLLDYELDAPLCPVVELIEEYKKYISSLSEQDLILAYGTGLSGKLNPEEVLDFDTKEIYDERTGKARKVNMREERRQELECNPDAMKLF